MQATGMRAAEDMQMSTPAIRLIVQNHIASTPQDESSSPQSTSVTESPELDTLGGSGGGSHHKQSMDSIENYVLQALPDSKPERTPAWSIPARPLL